MAGIDGERRAWQEMGSAGTPENDPDTFATAFTRIAPTLYDFLARLSGRSEAADALLRQAASQAAMSVASAPHWPSVRAWLFARAVAVLPRDSSAASADPAPFSDIDASRVPPSPPDSGLPDMARVVWRAISALSLDQHALLHLHIREAMVTAEAASVLGITEREAAERLNRVIAAVEETSRALFLIRYGRGRDPRLNELLTDHNVTRLTPELRGFLEDYLRTSPSAQAMLAAVPLPLTLYAAFRPLPVPDGLAAAATSGALPWLAQSGTAFPQEASGATTPVAGQQSTALFPPQTAPPPFDPGGATAVNASYGTGSVGPTAVNPALSPNGYDPPSYGSGGYDPYGYGTGTGYSAPPSGSGSIEGTQTLDIPVRQRVVAEQSAVFMPPRRPPRRGISPVAILGGVGGALVLIIGALIIFLSRGTSQPSAQVTATVGATLAPTAITSGVPEALLTSTAISRNRLLTATANAPTPTEIPTISPGTATPAPQPVRTGASGAATTGTPGASTESPVSVPSLSPHLTQSPIEVPAPRVTPIPTRAIPTMQATFTAQVIAATPTRTTSSTTTAATSFPTAITLTVPPPASVATAIAPTMPVPTVHAVATATAAKPGVSVVTTAPAGTTKAMPQSGSGLTPTPHP